MDWFVLAAIIFCFVAIAPVLFDLMLAALVVLVGICALTTAMFVGFFRALRNTH